MRIDRHKRLAFSLVELLVVIAIIAVLIGLLLPAVQKARAAAELATCGNNLKQMSLAMLNYHNDYGNFPAANPTFSTLPAAVTPSWMVCLLPYIEQNGIYTQIVMDKNYAAAGTPIKTYYCPADPQGMLIFPTAIYDGFDYNTSSSAPPEALTDYAGIAGINLINSGKNVGILNTESTVGVPIENITDGTSNTFMIGERPFCGPPQTTSGSAYTAFRTWDTSFSDNYGAVGMYAAGPNDNLSDNTWGVAVTTGNQMVVKNLQGATCAAGTYYFGQGPKNPLNFCSFNYMYSCHTGGANFASADGSVRFVSYTVNQTTLGYATTYAGGEVVEVEW